jgi:hypothetical protein
LQFCKSCILSNFNTKSILALLLECAFQDELKEYHDTFFFFLSFKWAWEAQFLSHAPVTLKSGVFFTDVQMILVSFFKIPNQKSVNQENPISFISLGRVSVKSSRNWKQLE